MPHWLTSSEAASYLGVSVATIRRWCNDKELPYLRTPGGQKRFSIEKLDEWIDEHQVESS